MILKNYNLNGTGTHTLVLAGVHGDETNSIKAVACADFNSLKASITVINAINVPGIKANTRNFIVPNNPDKNSVDLNRQFISKEYDLMETLTQLKNYIAGAKIIIDVHSSSACKNMVLLGTSAKEELIKRALEEAGIPCVTWNSTENTIRSYANSLNNSIAVTIELNGMGQVSNEQLEEESEFIKKVTKVLIKNYSEIISSKLALLSNYGEDLHSVYSRISGYVSYKPNYTDLFSYTYKKDEIIATITDLSTGNQELIKAPFDNCAVVDVNPVAYVVPSTELFAIAKIKELGKAPVRKPNPTPVKTKSSSLMADEKTVGYAFECEKDFANWCAENFGKAVHGVVVEPDGSVLVEKGYVEGVTVEADATPWDNFVLGDVRTNYFKADVKSSKDYAVASISAYLPEDKIQELMKLGKSEQAAWRILSKEYLEQNEVDYYVSYGKDEEVNVIPKKLVLDMLSEEGLKLETKTALGEVKSTEEEHTIKGKQYLRVYLPLTSWASQYAFRSQFMTLEDLVDLYK